MVSRLSFQRLIEGSFGHLLPGPDLLLDVVDLGVELRGGVIGWKIILAGVL